MSASQGRTNVVLLVIVLVTFALHLLVIAEPFGRDQGIFAYIGQAMLRGEAPYRDAWDHKTPGLYVVYATAFALFGSSMPSLHLFEGIVLAFGAGILFLVGRRLQGATVGLVGALLYGTSATLLFEWWDRGQAEVYMGVTGALAVYGLLRAFGIGSANNTTATGRRAAVAHLLPLGLSGVCAGLTLYLKPTGAGLLAGLALITVVLLRRSGWRSVLAGVAALGAGVLISIIPLLAYFAAHGALRDLYEAIIVFNSYHARIGGNPTLAGSVMGTLDFLASMNLLTPLALVGLWASLVGGAERSAGPAAGEAPTGSTRPALGGGILAVWLVGSAAGIWTQGKFFSYHWSSVLPPLALLAAWGALAVAREARRLRGGGAQRVAAVVCLAVVGVYVAALGRDHAPKWTRNVAHLTGRVSSQEYLSTFGHNILGRDVYWFSEAQQTADYLRAHTSSDDTVLVWGFQALVNYLADRRAPTRYIFTYPLTFDRPETAFRVEARRTFLRDLSQRPPVYVVLVTNDVNPLQPVDSLGLLAGFPEFAQIIAYDYHLETDIGEFHLYRRTAAP